MRPEDIAKQFGASLRTSTQSPQQVAEQFGGVVRTVENKTSSVPFPAVQGESPLKAGAKAIGNLPSSVFQFGKSIVDAVKNPIDTVKSIGSAAVGGVQKLIPGAQEQEKTFDAFTQALKERYGSLEALQKTATEDPFGFGSDVLGLVTGGAALTRKAPQLAETIGKVGNSTIRPIAEVSGVIADKVSDTVRYATSQATGLNRETITKILDNPQGLKDVNPELRIQTAQSVADVLDTRLDELSDLGKGYEEIRNTPTPVSIPSNTLTDVLNKYGVKLDDNRQIVTTPESRPLSPTDRNALQDFIDNYGSQTELTSNSFLNVREALSNLSKFEQGKTAIPQQIARDLRSKYDEIGKNTIKGLKELDEAYAPERQLLGQLKKDIFDPKTGELKDNAISKIANLTGKGKENLLERVRQIVPDIDERVELIKTIEDIERASDFKTGTYIKGALTGGGVFTGNVPVIIASILAQPSIAVPLLRGAGYVGQKARPILEALKTIVNDINNFSIPKSFINKEGNMKLGMSIEDVSQLNTKLNLPKSPEFVDAVKNTVGAEITPQGLKLKVSRYQNPNQIGEESIRTGVFYLPEEKSVSSKFYSGGKNGYGGTEKFTGTTVVQNPIFVKGATGGKAPEMAYDLLKGKGAYQKMRQDVLNSVLKPGRNPDEVDIYNILEKYGGNPGMAWQIMQYSKGGNTLPYAIQEHIVISEVRNAGYDSILGYSQKKDGSKFLSELVDTRETTYPMQGEEGTVHEKFWKKI